MAKFITYCSQAVLGVRAAVGGRRADRRRHAGRSDGDAHLGERAAGLAGGALGGGTCGTTRKTGKTGGMERRSGERGED